MTGTVDRQSFGRRRGRTASGGTLGRGAVEEGDGFAAIQSFTCNGIQRRGAEVRLLRLVKQACDPIFHMITVSAPPAFVTVLPMQVRLLLRQRTPPRRCLRRSPPPATPLQNAFVCWCNNQPSPGEGPAGPLLDLNSRRLPGLGTLHRFLGRRWRPAGGERQGSQRDEAPSKRRTSRIFCTSRVSIPRSAARAPGMVAQPTTTRRDLFVWASEN